MKSMPAVSAMRASLRQSGQLADQRSGTVVAERPDEQLAPNMPILSALALYIARRSRIDPVRLGKAFSQCLRQKAHVRPFFLNEFMAERQCTQQGACSCFSW